MKILDKILDNLTNIWNATPKDVPALTIQQGSGMYPLVSVDASYMYFHTGSYTTGMATNSVVDTLTLADYTMRELCNAINSKGYIATLSSEDPMNDNDYSTRKSYVLIEAYNVPLNPPAILTVFTASTWKLLYPIARAVNNSIANMEDAIPQMVATLTTGKWLDYWATFFTAQRVSGESDNSVRTRIFMNIANLKTNNIALAELIAFVIHGKVTIKDVAPALFEIDISPNYMSSSFDVIKTINSTKGGGIGYYLNYIGGYTQPYDTYFFDRYGMDFENSDKLSVKVVQKFQEIQFGRQIVQGSFMTNKDLTVSGRKLVESPINLMSDVVSIRPIKKASEVYDRLKYVYKPFIMNSSLLLDPAVALIPTSYSVDRNYKFKFTRSISEAYTKPAEVRHVVTGRSFIEPPYTLSDSAFMMNVSLLNSNTSKLVQSRINETISMTMTRAGVTINTATF